MNIALCPGSFDPVTRGHIDVIKRARSMFDSVVVGVAHNASKTYMFSLEERIALIEQSLDGLEGVTVRQVPGLLVDFATEVGAKAIVKGLRGAADFDSEQAMALLNRHMSGVETVFIMGSPNLAHVSSSHVKDIARYDGPYADLVPPAVAAAIAKRKENHV